MPKEKEAIFSIVFAKGMADKNRLPLAHVISTLREVDSMIREVGKKIQREAGVEKPDGDFGIELLAGATGLAFQKGSLKTASAITKDVERGSQAVERIIETADIIERKKIISIDDYRAPVLRGLASISTSQEKDGTVIRFQLAKSGKIVQKSSFSERGIEALRSMGGDEFAIESLTVFGKLRVLRDRSKVDREDDIWGELVEDNGNMWRIKFDPDGLASAQKYFTKQVVVTGDATYFRTKYPRIDVKAIEEDAQRDYVKGGEAFSKDYENVFGDKEAEAILKDLRE